MIFISHSTHDDAFVDNLRAALLRRGYETWVDHHDMPTGVLWDDIVEKQISRSDLMILVWSPTAHASENVGVEWREFKSKGRPIFILKLKDAPLPMRLRHINYLDFTNQAFFNEQMTKLLKALPPAPLSVTQSLAQSVLMKAEHEMIELSHKGDTVIRQNRDNIRPNQIFCVFPTQMSRTKAVSMRREKVLIGLGNAVDIDLTDYGAAELGVSRHHAVITLNNTLLYLTDLYSNNGTFVDHYRLPPEVPYPIQSDSLVRLGGLAMRIVFNPDTAATH